MGPIIYGISELPHVMIRAVAASALACLNNFVVVKKVQDKPRIQPTVFDIFFEVTVKEPHEGLAHLI